MSVAPIIIISSTAASNHAVADAAARGHAGPAIFELMGFLVILLSLLPLLANDRFSDFVMDRPALCLPIWGVGVLAISILGVVVAAMLGVPI